MREKYFYCEHCMVEFCIKVEPTMSDEEVQRQAQESIKWLNGEEMVCPVCEKTLEER